MENTTDSIQQITALSRELKPDALATWTPEKRKEFCDLFSNRSRASRFILIKTAEYIYNTAKHRKFIPDKYPSKIMGFNDYDSTRTGYSHKVGGREINELADIAKERAEKVIAGLPPLKDVVRIIDPAIADIMKQRDTLFEKGKALTLESIELSVPLDMADLDQKMSIAEFRAMVKKRENDRRDIVNKLDDIGKEGKELEDRINKFLFSGIPGLSEAVMQVIKEHYEQATALDTLNRRVGEQVQFGDSTAALDMLRRFEEDEVNVSDSIKEKFDKALEALKLNSASKVKPRRKLKGK